ncbi:DNA primase (fragment) [Sphingobacterium sp. PM2-P1-29]
MITQDSIDKVIDGVNIEDVIGKAIPLKQKGANFSGCCPFHEEKTPSFSVSPSRGIYKCFGCGAGGNVITFVQEFEHLDFPDAVRRLAKDYVIIIEETAHQEEDKEIKEKKATMYDLNKSARNAFMKTLIDLDDENEVKKYLRDRELSQDSIISFQIGYAPDISKFLSKKIIDSGFYGIGEELGLCRKNENGNVYDMFQKRVMFPIHNERGEIIAFSGRKMEDGKEGNPKYINSKASMIYRKEEVLYGLFQAQKEIRKQDCAILVEGNIDVIMMHQMGVTNTVASCGTAFTESHAKKLSRYCKSVIIMFDGDKAGKEATLKVIDVLLGVGFLKVQVIPMEDGWDPDSLCQREGVDFLPSKSK